MRFPISLTNLHPWKSWTTKTDPSRGFIKRNWVPTGRIDLATRYNGNGADHDQPGEFRLMVEERRIVESVTGLENLEIRWRQATLREAKVVVVQYHKYLTENSLIKFVVDEAALVPPIPKIGKPAEITVEQEQRPAA